MKDRIIQRFKDVTKEENWIIKILIGGILLYIPIVNAITLGYLVDLLDDVKEKREVRLPDWKNFEKLFKDGLPLALGVIVLIVANLILQIALGMIPCLGQILGFALSLLLAVCLPILITIFAYRLKEFKTWQEAAQLNSIVDTVKKDFKRYLPFSLGLLVCSILSMIIGCCVLWPIPYFLCCVVFYPFFGEIYTGNEMLRNPPTEVPPQA